MKLEQVDIVVALKQHLENHQQRLRALEGERMVFNINVKQLGIDFTMMSNPHSPTDKESSGLSEGNRELIKRILIVEVKARIEWYTAELEAYGVETKSTLIKAA